MTAFQMTMNFASTLITNRDYYNPNEYEGGALNANYKDVEAALIITSRLSNLGYEYKTDFYFVTCGFNRVKLEFYNEKCAADAFIIFEGDYSNG
jgi:hypothetical protein